MGRRLMTAMCLITGMASISSPTPSVATGMLSEMDAAAEGSPAVAARLEVERRAVELTTDTALALESHAPFVELSIANPDIADISTISNNSLYLLGKRPGRTTLMLMGEGGQLISIIDVQVSPDISELRTRLSEILPGEEIETFTANDGIVLTGRISGRAQMDRALAIAGHYAPGRISNLMTIETAQIAGPDLSGFEVQLRKVLPDEQFEVAIVNEGIVLSGEASSPAARDMALALAERYAPGRVTSLLASSAPAAEVPDAQAVARHIREILPREAIEVHVLGEALVLSGRATSPEAANRAVEVAMLAAGGGRISNLISVNVSANCSVRTRRGGEVVETTIPCREPQTTLVAPMVVPESRLDIALVASQPSRASGSLRPRARPERVDVD